MGIKVALTQSGIEQSVEANKPRRFQPVPAGKQNFTIYDAELNEFGPNSKSPGEQYYSVDLRIDGGPHNGRKITRVMIPFRTNWNPSPDPAKREKHPDGYPTNFVPFFQALGYEVSGKAFEVPEIADILGKPISGNVGVELDDYGFKRAQEEGELEEGEGPDDFKRNNVQRFKPAFDRKDEAGDDLGLGSGLL